MNKLLQIAKDTKKFNRTNRASDDEIELVIEWIKGNINTLQVAKALGVKFTSNALYRISVVTRQAYEDGKLKV